MKKLQALIRYEFETTFKYIFLFYAICYSVIALVYLLILILQGHFEDAGTSCLDMNSLVFLSIISSVGFTEDLGCIFKMALPANIFLLEPPASLPLWR